VRENGNNKMKGKKTIGGERAGLKRAEIGAKFD
jgi:hypothetical protein